MEGSSSQGLSEAPVLEGGGGEGGGGGGEDETKKVEEELMAKAQKLMEKITSSPDNPNPSVLHALSSLFEVQESLYVSFSSSVSIKFISKTYIYLHICDY